MSMQHNDFFAGRTIAVIGVSRDHGKFGRIVYENLKERGYEVIPVNPALADVDDVPCYPSLAEVPGEVDMVVTVVPPKVTAEVVKAAIARGISRIWMQPGSENEAAIQEARAAGIDVVANACILLTESQD